MDLNKETRLLFNELEETYITEEESQKFLIENEENFMTFSKGIKRELAKLGCSGSDDVLYNEFYKRLKKHGVAPSKHSVSKGWFYGTSVIKRENAIKVCFALEFNHIDAKDFLNNVCSENDFIFRDAKEIIFYYCLKYNKSYSDALDLYQKYNDLPLLPNTKDNLSTKMIKQDFEKLPNNDEYLLNLLQINKQEFEIKSKTAYELYKDLKNILIDQIEKDPDYIRNSSEIRESPDEKSMSNPVFIRSLLVGLPVVFNRKSETSDDNKETKKIKEDIENETNKEKILMQLAYSQLKFVFKTISLDINLIEKQEKAVPRELLILYRYFCQFYNFNPEETTNPYGTFYNDMNVILDECGMGRLYPKNPFDWLILTSIIDINNDPFLYFNEVIENSFKNDDKETMFF